MKPTFLLTPSIKLLDEIIANDVFREDYEQITVQLLYQPLSYGTALQTLRLISEMVLF